MDNFLCWLDYFKLENFVVVVFVTCPSCVHYTSEQFVHLSIRDDNIVGIII